MISASSLSAFSAGASAGSIRSQTTPGTDTGATGRVAGARRHAAEPAQRAAALTELPASPPSKTLPRGSLVNVQA